MTRSPLNMEYNLCWKDHENANIILSSWLSSWDLRQYFPTQNCLILWRFSTSIGDCFYFTRSHLKQTKFHEEGAREKWKGNCSTELLLHNLYVYKSVVSAFCSDLPYWKSRLCNGVLEIVSNRKSTSSNFLWLKQIYFPCILLCCIKYETFLLFLYIWHINIGEIASRQVLHKNYRIWNILFYIISLPVSYLSWIKLCIAFQISHMTSYTTGADSKWTAIRLNNW